MLCDCVQFPGALSAYRISQERRTGAETKKEREYFEGKIVEISEGIYRKYYDRSMCGDHLRAYWGTHTQPFLQGSEGVDIKISHKSGKGVVAKRSYRRGDVVFWEVPIASHRLLRVSSALSRPCCSHCLRSYSDAPQITQHPTLLESLVLFLLLFVLLSSCFVVICVLVSRNDTNTFVISSDV